MNRLLNIGFGNCVNGDKIISVVSPDAAPIKRMVQQAKEEGRVIDATQGRRTRAVLVVQGDYLILSALQPDTISKRFAQEWEAEPDEA
ncbi:MAG TPA: DUF370 domain-containing protein [Lachnospiraceae bacterium]